MKWRWRDVEWFVFSLPPPLRVLDRVMGLSVNCSLGLMGGILRSEHPGNQQEASGSLGVDDQIRSEKRSQSITCRILSLTVAPLFSPLTQVDSLEVIIDYFFASSITTHNPCSPNIPSIASLPRPACCTSQSDLQHLSPGLWQFLST